MAILPPDPPHPIRVLHVLACDAAAGTELMTATLAEESRAHGIAPTIATLDRPGPIAARLTASGVPVHSLGGRLPTLALARLIRRVRPDVICGYGFSTGLATRVLARLVRPRPRVVTGVRGLHVSGFDDPRSPRGRFIMAVERLTSPLVDTYVANSSGAIDVLVAHGVQRDRIRRVPNGLDTSAWTVADRTGRTGTPLVACVARFNAVKRHVDLVEAAQLLRERGIDISLAFAGAGDERPKIEEQVRAAGLTDTVRFLGVLDRSGLAAFLADADIATLASTREGMPGSVMEAMASGLPVVGTEVNGIRDLVVDGQTGLLVPPRSPAALADAIGALVIDRDRRRALGAAGRVRIEREFSLNRMVSDTCAIHRELAAATKDGIRTTTA